MSFDHNRTRAARSLKLQGAGLDRSGEKVRDGEGVVRGQYEDLPYPEFTLEDMAREQSYYSGPATPPPLLYQHTNSLDLVNHYLFRGRQTWENAR